MPVNETEKLGKRLGDGKRSQENTDANISPDDSSGQFNFNFTNNLEVRGKATFTKLYYLDDSFVLDHPERGELDSNYYKLDGGHDTGIKPATPFPLVFTYTFGKVRRPDPTEIILTKNF